MAFCNATAACKGFCYEGASGMQDRIAVKFFDIAVVPPDIPVFFPRHGPASCMAIEDGLELQLFFNY